MSRVRFPSPAPTLCDAIISPQPPVRLRLQAWSNGEAGGRSYADAENRLPIGNVDDHDLWGFRARSRRCVVQESCEAMSKESVSCSIFKSNQDQRRGYRAASGIQWKPCRSGRTNSLFWALGSGERPGNRRQRFCETDPMASGFGILGKTQRQENRGRRGGRASSVVLSWCSE